MEVYFKRNPAEMARQRGGREMAQCNQTTRSLPPVPYPAGEADEPLESWEADDFDHFTDLGLVRVFDDN